MMTEDMTGIQSTRTCFPALPTASSTISDKSLRTWFLTVFRHVRIQRSTYQNLRCIHIFSLCIGITEVRIPSPSLCMPYIFIRESHNHTEQAEPQHPFKAEEHQVKSRDLGGVYILGAQTQLLMLNINSVSGFPPLTSHCCQQELLGAYDCWKVRLVI